MRKTRYYERCREGKKKKVMTLSQVHAILGLLHAHSSFERRSVRVFSRCPVWIVDAIELGRFLVLCNKWATCRLIEIVSRRPCSFTFFFVKNTPINKIHVFIPFFLVYTRPPWIYLCVQSSALDVYSVECLQLKRCVFAAYISKSCNAHAKKCCKKAWILRKVRASSTATTTPA